MATSNVIAAFTKSFENNGFVFDIPMVGKLYLSMLITDYIRGIFPSLDDSDSSVKQGVKEIEQIDKEIEITKFNEIQQYLSNLKTPEEIDIRIKELESKKRSITSSFRDGRFS